MSFIMTNEHDPENVLRNIILMEDKKFGESKKWKGMKKKLQKDQLLDDNEYQYYRQIGDEYTKDLTNKREWQQNQIEKLEYKGIGDKSKWIELKQKLQDGQNLQGVDYEYFLAKLREYEQGVVTTTLDVEGREIVAYLGIVSGQTVIGLNFIKDSIMGLTDTFGGRSGIMERNFRTAKDEAVKQMTEDGKRMGGNAVIGVSVDFNSIEGKNKQMLMVIATGTAVITRARK